MAAIAVCACGWRSKRTTHNRAHHAGEMHRCRPPSPELRPARCRACGWVGTPTTPSRARYAKRQHRCSRQQWRDEMAARVTARETASGPYRACKHKVARHHHGTHACYVLDKCRCRPCRVATRDYENRRKMQRAAGIEAYVDAEPVRAHIRELQAQGLGLKTLTRLTGLSGGVLNKLIYGTPRADRRQPRRPPCRRVRPATAAKIFAVRADLDSLGQTAPVDAGATLRRLQALVCAGYSIAYLGSRIGNSNLHKVFDSDRVYAETARRVRDLFTELESTVPPQNTQQQKSVATRARNYAAQLGWQPAEAWDDIDTGVPLELDDDIDDVVVDRIAAGEPCPHANDAEITAATQLMTDRGLSPSAIAERIRTSRQRALRIAG